MLKYISVLLLCLCGSQALVPPMPAFIWSGSDSLRPGSVELPQSLSPSDLTDFVKHVSGASVQPRAEITARTTATLPSTEVVLVFVHPELHTSQVTKLSSAFDQSSDGAVFRNLKATLTASHGSMTFPYVYKTSTSLMDELSQASVTIVDAEDAPAYVHGHQHIYTDNKADVIVVRFSESGLSGDALTAKLRKDDELMGQITNKVNKLSNGHYLGIMTANSPGHSEPMAQVLQSKQQVLLASKAQSKAQSKSGQKADDDTPLYMTTGILSAILVMFVLFIISSIGITALAVLKTPDQWEKEGGFLSPDN